MAEIAALLAPVADLVARPAQMGEVVEDADTLEGNARLKAAAVAAVAGAPAVADDTGLEVDALDGAPGVYSARFAGESASYADNRRLLLERMEGVPASQRTARFRTVVVVDWADGT
ncbi:MAG: non-canonical purine NTP pyrophosphatase, partial [Ilumatobacteraceae bacterium]